MTDKKKTEEVEDSGPPALGEPGGPDPKKEREAEVKARNEEAAKRHAEPATEEAE